MNRLPPLQHPLAALFQRAAQSLTTSLNQDAFRFYNGTLRNFLNFLGAQYPQVQSLAQLRRDPHILAWLTGLRSRQPPLATITYSIHLTHLRCMLQELAWTEDLPALARLILRQDTPRAEHYLPRPLTVEQDRLTQQELLRRDDRNSNAFLLLRHTGMRIGECADLSFDCLHLVGAQRWAIHVPLGKLKTERMVPADAFVVRLVERLRLLRSQDPLPADGFLLARPSSRNALLRSLRSFWRDIVASVGITNRLVPHQLRHSCGQYRRWSVAPASIDLYNGLPGIALFLSQLGVVTNEHRYRELVERAVNSVRRTIEKNRGTITSIGGFNGWGGLVYMFTRLGDLWQREELWQEARNAAAQIPELIQRDDRLDIIGGAAESIGALTGLHRCTSSPAVLNAAIQCGEHLLQRAQPAGEGMAWPALFTSGKALTSFSHGAAGMAWALQQLAGV